MVLIINLIAIILIVISMIIDINRIKSNKELIKKYNEVLKSHRELGNKLDSKKDMDKEINGKIEKMKEYYKELKDNLSINYDHLAEEVIKRINENGKNKDITLEIDGEEISKLVSNSLNDICKS